MRKLMVTEIEIVNEYVRKTENLFDGEIDVFFMKITFMFKFKNVMFDVEVIIVMP